MKFGAGVFNSSVWNGGAAVIEPPVDEEAVFVGQLTGSGVLAGNLSGFSVFSGGLTGSSVHDGGSTGGAE